MKQIMYIGPDIRGIVRKNQIFTYWPDNIIDKVADIYSPAIQLFIKMDDVAQRKSELRRSGSLLNIVYKQLEKKL